jgi:hypothetical protein
MLFSPALVESMALSLLSPLLPVLENAPVFAGWGDAR